MIRHTLLFRFKPEVSEEQRADVLDWLRRLPEQFPAMRNFALGDNHSARDDRFSHGMVIEFRTWDELTDYLGSRVHEEFVAGRFRPAMAERAIVSFDDGGTAQPERE